jgi:hypothetical protein
MNELVKIFGQPQGTQRFDQSKFRLLLRNALGLGPLVKLKSQKPSTTGHLSRSVMVCSVHVFLALLRTTNACVANTSG